MPLIDTRTDGDIGTIILDHLERRNALSRQLVNAIVETLQRFSHERTRVVVLRAHPGVKVWSAGHDVDELPEGGRDPLGWDDPLRYLVRAIEELPAPVIAMIEGGVWGGALEVAFACDLIVTAQTATFVDAGQARCALQCFWYAHLSQRMLTPHCEGNGVYGEADHGRTCGTPWYRQPRGAGG